LVIRQSRGSDPPGDLNFGVTIERAAARIASVHDHGNGLNNATAHNAPERVDSQRQLRVA
jgi:hypothetical protein